MWFRSLFDGSSFARTPVRQRARAAEEPRHRRSFRPHLETLDDRALLSSYMVNSLTDTGAGAGLTGDLRYCVTRATSGNDTISFGITGTIRLQSALPALNTSVAIQGPGANLLRVERDGATSSYLRIFQVGSDANVQISGLTMANGIEGYGGAILNAGTLTVSNSTVSGNTAIGSGGAVYNLGTLDVSSSTISGNSSTDYYGINVGYGGAIYNRGTASVRNSTISANSGLGYGGAIFNDNAGTLTVSNSTISGNTAVGPTYLTWGDGPYPYLIGGDGAGGGVYIAGGMVSIDHSTLADNHAYGGDGLSYGYGGGIFNRAGTSALRVHDTILADNTADYGLDLYGSLTSLGHNLFGISAYANGLSASDLRDVDPRLGPLQDNGGATPTMALLSGSPAVNTGDDTGAPAYDQRGPGFPRSFGGATDIGAFEVQADLPPTILITDVSLPEGNVGTTAAQFTVRLSSASTETVTVRYSTADGGATVSDNDYQAVSGTLTFAPGQTSQIVTVPIHGDRRYESNEAFVVNLGEVTNATVADGQGLGTIVDEEPVLWINTETMAQEGNSGTVSFIFTVRLSTTYDVPVTVDFTTADGSATGSDYQATAGTLTIPAGQLGGTITVLVNGDRIAEPNETFSVNLGNLNYGAISNGQGTGVIVDNEPRVSIGDVAMQEGRKGKTKLFTFTVTLSAAYDQPVTVSFRTMDVTARASDGDYVAKTGTLTFAPGETTKTITIQVKGDSKREADEYFILDLFDLSSNAFFGKSRGDGWILNDDR
jgi:hypothetical protein